jgi:hypothetical protein
MIINEMSFPSPADIKVLLQRYVSAERLIIIFNFEYNLKELSNRIWILSVVLGSIKIGCSRFLNFVFYEVKMHSELIYKSLYILLP